VGGVMDSRLINEELYDFLNKKFPKCMNDLLVDYSNMLLDETIY
jgi:hypothetical protein